MKVTRTQVFFAAVIAGLVIGAWYMLDQLTFWAVFMLIFADKLGSDRNLWRVLSKKTRRPISEGKLEILNRASDTQQLTPKEREAYSAYLRSRLR